MSSSGAGATTTIEKLDTLYFCGECKMVFLFKADAADHGRIKGHSRIREMPFEG
jgi:hypothetical protein